MKPIFKSAPGLAAIFLLLASACLNLIASGRQSSGAQDGKASGEVKIDGLRARVTVRRDERGIPYIEAANESDLYFAQGYVTASDRLWQMDLLRRTARGELSEIFGKVALEEDKRRRTYGFAVVAEATIAHAPAEVRDALEAYARGVNAFINSLTLETLPIEFRILKYQPRPWTISDSIVIGKNFAEALSNTWRLDLMREKFASLPADKRGVIFPIVSPRDVLVVGADRPRRRNSISRVVSQRASKQRLKFDDASMRLMRALAEIETTIARSRSRIGVHAEDSAASNNWVVSGKRTASGKPLLADDPHLQPTAPSIWYMTHLSAPGLRVAGVATPGAPGIIIGHNERIAWGLTNLGPDVQDIYREKFDPQNSRRYQTPAGWRDAEVRREEIKVRKSPVSTETEIVSHEVTVTRHGPVIFEQEGARYALRWTALNPQVVDFEAFAKINRARNWNEFRQALKLYRGPTQNFVYADVDGNIGYYGAGQIPVRKSGDGSVPYDGATDAGEWKSFIPFGELPHIYNPASGIIVTANSRVVGESYPYHLTHVWAAPDRARRIYDLLAAKEKLTVDDFRAVQGDVHSLSAILFAREVVEVARAEKSKAKSGDDKWQEMIQMFDGWDGNLEAESRAALLATEMRDVLQRRILAATLGEEMAKAYIWPNRATFINWVITERPRAWLPSEYNDYAALLRACLEEARLALAKRYGVDESKWMWGRAAQVRFQHPISAIPVIGQQFSIAPFPQRGGGGSFATVNVGSGVSRRLIADPGKWDNTQHGITLGQSGDPSSIHWKDQLTDWRAVTPRAFPFSTAAVNAATKQTIVLAPAAK
ncbi:MAG TPA: penicillin acylase family protein [Pyrinomonadaceae bacterium]|nr:penicillin acylase family protein [Pyrinomonadaceae bacterium]